MRMKPKFVSLLLVLSGLFASFAEAASLPSDGNGAFLYAVGQSATFGDPSLSTTSARITD